MLKVRTPRGSAIIPGSLRATKSTNPLLKIAFERPKSEPFAQNGGWNAESANPLREMAAGAPKVRTLCPKYKVEHPRYKLRLIQFALSAGLLPIMRRQPFLEGSLGRCPPLLFSGKCFGNVRGTLRKTPCGAPQAPHSEVKPVGKQCARGKDIAECGRI